MAKIKTYVFETNDYGVFYRLEDNRSVTESRKNQLIASFSAGEVMCPIIVNEKMEIIDGQGRFEARKALELPIYYIIDPGKNINDCRRMNSYNHPGNSTATFTAV